MVNSRPGLVLSCSLGLLFGTGACYWAYRWLFHKGKGNGRAGEEKGTAANAGKAAQAGERSCQSGNASGLLEKVSGIRVTSGGEKAPTDDHSKSASGNLQAHHLQKLIRLLQTTEYCSVREQVLITLSNSAAFSVNQDLIRELGGLSVIGETLSDPSTEVKVKALNALNNLSMNRENQEHIQVYISEICSDVALSPLNSDLQLAGLRLLTNMSVTNDYQQMMVNKVPYFLHLLSAGNETTQIHVLKVLVNLSANPAMTKDLLSVQAPPLLIFLFDSHTHVDVLLRALTFVANLNDNLRSQLSSAGHCQYSEESLFSLFFGESEYSQRLALLLQHPDADVKRCVARIMTKQS
ncbi:armadillo repeat-containing protein 10 isoform X1 [Rhinatrema bivittatum]|uniref:armadillo repeat-containing protein 10 isoform X1 n=1 Tax=Rhinatrema bivittatum TaxID=194408 RepID=UPI001129DD96|nr:armadillo repeat-containing protein 10 isoform X1 [Rhinatrema bivittatum]